MNSPPTKRSTLRSDRIASLAIAALLAAGLLASSTPAGAQAASHAAAAPRELSTHVVVSGAVVRPGSYDLAALQALPSTTATAGKTSYTGVGLWTLLATVAGLKTDPETKNQSLAMVVVATGSDGYRAVFSLGELDPAFGNQPDLVAYAANGSGLGSSGIAKIVVPNDGKGGRAVSNLVSLQVVVAGDPPSGASPPR